MPKHTMKRSFVLVAAAAFVAPSGAQVPAPAQPAKLDWHGDPKAPDIAGVWIRADPQTPGVSKEGWGPWPPPLKGEFAETWRKRVADAAAATRTDDPVQACLPAGMPRFVTGMTGPMLILQTPGRVMLYRDGIPVRRVWLDGRPLPAEKDLESFSNGNATGRYVGDALVTQIAGIKDQPIDATGVPHSDALRVSERYRRVDADTLQVEVTLTDPQAYSRPVKSTVVYKKYGDPLWEPKEFLCTPKTDYHPERYVR